MKKALRVLFSLLVASGISSFASELSESRIRERLNGTGVAEYELQVITNGIYSLHLSECPRTADHHGIDLTPLRDLPLTKLSLDCCFSLTDLHPIANLKLISLVFDDADVLSNLWPLRGMSLQELDVSYTRVNDLSPLKGMPLRTLKAYGCVGIVDLTPLRGMPLASLSLGQTWVSDIQPLHGMPLEYLDLSYSQVTNLSPLAGAPLRRLDLWNVARVKDLSPLSGMKLEHLDIGYTAVTDISTLRNMPVVYFSCSGTKVADLLPLTNSPLRELYFPLKSTALTIHVLRTMKTLESMNGMNAFDFWKKYDAGELKIDE